MLSGVVYPFPYDETLEAIPRGECWLEVEEPVAQQGNMNGPVVGLTLDAIAPMT